MGIKELQNHHKRLLERRIDLINAKQRQKTVKNASYLFDLYPPVRNSGTTKIFRASMKAVILNTETKIQQTTDDLVESAVKIEVLKKFPPKIEEFPQKSPIIDPSSLLPVPPIKKRRIDTPVNFEVDPSAIERLLERQLDSKNVYDEVIGRGTGRIGYA